MAEQNTKPECECKCHYGVQIHTTAKAAGLRIDCSHCDPRQRHQLKQQVLEAVGKDEEIVYPNDGGTYFQITPYVNEEKAEIRKRIEAVFDDEAVK